jgi:predicted N-acetyltransferase YhbS
MSTTIDIRTEGEDDVATIRELTQRAFAPMPYADGDEPELIDRLRASGALALSLVATEAGTLVGQVTFSPAVGDASWFALGPVSVEPARQGEGIGAALIREGLRRLGERGAHGCMLVGNPAYYARFGFELAPALCPPTQPEAYFQALVLEAPPTAALEFDPAFYVPAP